MYRFGHHAHHPVFGIVLLLILVALLAVAIVALVRLWKTRAGHVGTTPQGTLAGHHVDPALTELRMRYARGEMTSDEYRLRASHLGYQVPPSDTQGGLPPEGQQPPPAA